MTTTRHKDYDHNTVITISTTGCPIGHTLYLEHVDRDNKGKLKVKIPSVIRDLYTYRTPPPQFDCPSFVMFEHSHNSKYHPSSLTKAPPSCIAHNSNICYVGNNWDSSLRVYRLEYTTSTNNINDDQNKLGKSSKHKRQSKPHLGTIKWRLVQSFKSHKARISCIDTDGIHLASGSDDCTVVIWQIRNSQKPSNMDHFTFDVLLHHKKRHGKHQQNKEDSAANGSGHQSANGLISNSKCVLRGHQSPIVAIALHSELDICVSCSSQGLILIHTVQHGEYRHSLYLSGDICGRGASINNLQFKHIPDGAREYPSELDQVTGNEAHPDIRHNPFDVTSPDDEQQPLKDSVGIGSASDTDLSSRVDLMFTRFGIQEEEEQKEPPKSDVARRQHSQSSLMSLSDWGDRCQIDIVRISREGRIVMLSKTCNVIFSWYVGSGNAKCNVIEFVFVRTATSME